MWPRATGERNQKRRDEDDVVEAIHYRHPVPVHTRMIIANNPAIVVAVVTVIIIAVVATLALGRRQEPCTQTHKTSRSGRRRSQPQ